MMLLALVAGFIVASVVYMTYTPRPARSAEVWALPEADREALRAHIEVVAAEEHNMFTLPALERTAAYIETQLSKLGYKVGQQHYRTAGIDVRNIEVEITGGERADAIIVMGAHYDSVHGAPGANDNGSGVAALLELARILKDHRPHYSWRLVWFVNEEPPYFKTEQMGSRVYARRSRDRNEDIRAMFSLETIGYFSDEPGTQRYPFPFNLLYPDRGNFIAFVSNFSSRRLLHRALDAFRVVTDFPAEGVASPAFIPGIDWSDHASFWNEGYAALMITDTAPFRYPFYHSPADTPDKVNYVRLEQLVNALARMLCRMDRDAPN